jgi:hypothetical protein
MSGLLADDHEEEMLLEKCVSNRRTIFIRLRFVSICADHVAPSLRKSWH